MRTILLNLAAMAIAVTATAQTVVVSDDIESYTVGQGIAEQGFDTGWKLWNANNTTFDALVSDAQAFSGSNSIHMLQTSNDDIVFDVGTPYTTGKYDVIFKMFIPSGKEGYFNLMHSWDLTSTNQYEWAVDVFFAANGTITWVTGSTTGGTGQFQHNGWFEMQISVDLDSDEGRLYHNGQLMHIWQWSLNNANGNAGLNQLKVVNFFAYGPSQNNGEYYIDDFEIINSTGVSVDERLIEGFTLYPNPANEVVNIDLSAFSNPLITLYGIDGKIIDRFTTTQGGIVQVPVSRLTAGVYFVEVVQGAERLTRRLIVRH